MSSEQPKEWLDFATIKQQADPVQVLDALGLLDSLTEVVDKQNGPSLVGWCPIGARQHGKKDSFYVYTEKKTFKCHACKQRGSLLDLVARVREVPLREAAAHLLAISNGTAPPTAAALPPAAPANQPTQAPAELPSADQEDDSIFAELQRGELRVTLSLFEAVRLVKAKQRHPQRLIVIDLDVLAALQELVNRDSYSEL